MAKWRKVCLVEQVEEGMPLGVHEDGKQIAIFRLGDRCYATSDICTHELALLSEGWQNGDLVECPLHQARFRITDGKCLGGPAETDLETFPIKIDGEGVYVLL